MEQAGPKWGQDGGKMYGWGRGVCILVWAYKKRENISLSSKMYACHPPPYILESGKMYAPPVHLRILPPAA